jgi:hypothetical protein
MKGIEIFIVPIITLAFMIAGTVGAAEKSTEKGKILVAYFHN